MFFKVLSSLIHWFQPFLVPICFIAAWALVLSMLWRTFEITQNTVKQAKQMHQIPCSDCQFFTEDYNLKCPVHPMTALSEDAIACPDYHKR